MREATALNVVWRVVVAIGAVLGSAVQAGTPDFEVLSGSSITLIGSSRTVVQQTVACRPAWQSGYDLRSTGNLVLPNLVLGLGEEVAPYQNQSFLLTLDPQTGEMSMEFSMWLIEPTGGRVAVPMTLTTGVPDTRDCGNFLFCTGPSPAHCVGSPWNPGTGLVRLVGIALVPATASLGVTCEGISLVIEARIDPADQDGDNVIDALDSCPGTSNPAQADADGDGIGDACDNCNAAFNPGQADADLNGVGNACQPVRVNFQPGAAPIPAGYSPDSGAIFGASSSFGWLANGGLQFFDRNAVPDQLLDTVALSTDVRRWEATLPGGLHDLTLVMGDSSVAQGPHLLLAEGVTVFDDVTTLASEHLSAVLPGMLVADGRLTVDFGGGGGPSAWNYVSVNETGVQPYYARYVNFQPAASPVPPGFVVDSGLVFDNVRGYGWGSVVQTRDRNASHDQVLDTLLHPNIGEIVTWNLKLPADFYQIQLSVGDPQFAQGPHKVTVEGETWIAGVPTSAGQHLTVSGRRRVLDGQLTITLGQAGSRTTPNYVSVTSLPIDFDGDGVINLNDNCLELANPDQDDFDGDLVGDDCDPDADGDGAANGEDCLPLNGVVFAEPTEVSSVRLSGKSPTLISWVSQSPTAGSGTVYDVVTQLLSSLRGAGNFTGATCLVNNRSTASYSDNRPVTIGDGHLYLVRAANACGVGTYGSGSGVPDPRSWLDTAVVCP